MSLAFTAGSSTGMSYPAAWTLALPFTVGMWVYPTTTGTQRYIYNQADNVSITDGRLGLLQDTADVWGIEAFDGTTEDIATAGTVVANQWTFLIGRFISSSNRRLSVQPFSGTPVHAQGTTAITPGGSLVTYLANTQIDGTPSSFFSGYIAEVWFVRADIQADGAQLQNTTLWQLAFGGPLSMPHIAKDLFSYQSFSLGPSVTNTKGYTNSENYIPKGDFVWNISTAVTTAPHPPLPYWYVKPGQNKELLVV